MGTAGRGAGLQGPPLLLHPTCPGLQAQDTLPPEWIPQASSQNPTKTGPGSPGDRNQSSYKVAVRAQEARDQSWKAPARGTIQGLWPHSPSHVLLGVRYCRADPRFCPFSKLTSRPPAWPGLCRFTVGEAEAGGGVSSSRFRGAAPQPLATKAEPSSVLPVTCLPGVYDLRQGDHPRKWPEAPSLP